MAPDRAQLILVLYIFKRSCAINKKIKRKKMQFGTHVLITPSVCFKTTGAHACCAYPLLPVFLILIISVLISLFV
jgi:hypothetical protein